MPRQKCIHGKRKDRCVDCHGSGICEHNKCRYQCRECGGSSICEHQKRRAQCKVCNIISWLSCRVSSRIYSSQLKGLLGKSVEEYLGCSIMDYKDYLETKFLDNMTWENHGTGGKKWQIDHIKPINPKNPITDEEVICRLHYTNTQCLWETDNKIKKNKEETKIKLTIHIK